MCARHGGATLWLGAPGSRRRRRRRAMRTAVVTAKPRDHSGSGTYRALGVLALAPPILLPPIYFGIAAYAADRLSHPARHLPTSTPAQCGLTYEDVQFSSAV